MALTVCRNCLHRTFPLSTPHRSSITLTVTRSVGSGGRSSLILWEKNKRGTMEPDPPKPPVKERVKFIRQNFVPETKKWFGELKDAVKSQPMIEAEHGNYEILWKFDSPESVSSWRVSADKDNAGGYSTAHFTFSKNRTGLFHGYLNKTVPKDGVLKYAGYTNISSPRPKKSFLRDTNWDWSIFNCLLLRLRGDGRPYNIVIGYDFHFDLNWLIRYQCPLHTTGGPYWQNLKIPLSKFYKCHSGRIQDMQEHVPLDKVNSFGITCGDSGEGPFYLEIDSIALMYDCNISTAHAYEVHNTKYWEIT